MSIVGKWQVSHELSLPLASSSSVPLIGGPDRRAAVGARCIRVLTPCRSSCRPLPETEVPVAGWSWPDGRSDEPKCAALTRCACSSTRPSTALLISERASRTFLALEFRQPIYSFYGPHRPSGPLPFSVFIPDPHWRSVLLGKILSKLFSFTLCDVIPTILLFSVFFLPSFMLCFSRCSFEKYFTLGMLKSYLEYLYFYNIYGELMY